MVCPPTVVQRTDWCTLKQQVESGAKSLSDVLNGLTLDVTIVPASDAYWVEDEAGGRLGGIVADILNWTAIDANFTYNLYAIPSPAKTGYLDSSGGAGWDSWTVDQASRTDLLAQWTTDTWKRQALGVVWPFHHLHLDHVRMETSNPQLMCSLMHLPASPTTGRSSLYALLVRA